MAVDGIHECSLKMESPGLRRQRIGPDNAITFLCLLTIKKKIYVNASKNEDTAKEPLNITVSRGFTRLCSPNLRVIRRKKKNETFANSKAIAMKTRQMHLFGNRGLMKAKYLISGNYS